MTAAKGKCGFTWLTPTAHVAQCKLELDHSGDHEADAGGKLERCPPNGLRPQPFPGVGSSGLMEIGPNGLVRIMPGAMPAFMKDFLGIGQPPSQHGPQSQASPPNGHPAPRRAAARRRGSKRAPKSAPLDAVVPPSVEADKLLHGAMGNKSDATVAPPASPSAGKRLLSRELKEIQAQHQRMRRSGEAWFKACVVPEAKAIISQHGIDAAAWIVKALLLEMLHSVKSIRDACPSSADFDAKLSDALSAVGEAETARSDFIDHIRKHHG